jgi:hypothetical protein
LAWAPWVTFDPGCLVLEQFHRLAGRHACWQFRTAFWVRCFTTDLPEPFVIKAVYQCLTSAGLSVADVGKCRPALSLDGVGKNKEIAKGMGLF